MDMLLELVAYLSRTKGEPTKAIKFQGAKGPESPSPDKTKMKQGTKPSIGDNDQKTERAEKIKPGKPTVSDKSKTFEKPTASVEEAKLSSAPEDEPDPLLDNLPLSVEGKKGLKGKSKEEQAIGVVRLLQPNYEGGTKGEILAKFVASLNDVQKKLVGLFDDQTVFERLFEQVLKDKNGALDVEAIINGLYDEADKDQLYDAILPLLKGVSKARNVPGDQTTLEAFMKKMQKGLVDPEKYIMSKMPALTSSFLDKVDETIKVKVCKDIVDGNIVMAKLRMIKGNDADAFMQGILVSRLTAEEQTLVGKHKALAFKALEKRIDNVLGEKAPVTSLDDFGKRFVEIDLIGLLEPKLRGETREEITSQFVDMLDDSQKALLALVDKGTAYMAIREHVLSGGPFNSSTIVEELYQSIADKEALYKRVVNSVKGGSVPKDNKAPKAEPTFAQFVNTIKSSLLSMDDYLKEYLPEKSLASLDNDAKDALYGDLQRGNKLVAKMRLVDKDKLVHIDTNTIVNDQGLLDALTEGMEDHKKKIIDKYRDSLLQLYGESLDQVLAKRKSATILGDFMETFVNNTHECRVRQALKDKAEKLFIKNAAVLDATVMAMDQNEMGQALEDPLFFMLKALDPQLEGTNYQMTLMERFAKTLNLTDDMGKNLVKLLQLPDLTSVIMQQLTKYLATKGQMPIDAASVRSIINKAFLQVAHDDEGKHRLVAGMLGIPMSEMKGNLNAEQVLKAKWKWGDALQFANSIVSKVVGMKKEAMERFGNDFYNTHLKSSKDLLEASIIRTRLGAEVVVLSKTNPDLARLRGFQRTNAIRRHLVEQLEAVSDSNLELQYLSTLTDERIETLYIKDRLVSGMKWSITMFKQHLVGYELEDDKSNNLLDFFTKHCSGCQSANCSVTLKKKNDNKKYNTLEEAYASTIKQWRDCAQREIEKEMGKKKVTQGVDLSSYGLDTLRKIKDELECFIIHQKLLGISTYDPIKDNCQSKLLLEVRRNIQNDVFYRLLSNPILIPDPILLESIQKQAFKTSASTSYSSAHLQVIYEEAYDAMIQMHPEKINDFVNVIEQDLWDQNELYRSRPYEVPEVERKTFKDLQTFIQNQLIDINDLVPGHQELLKETKLQLYFEKMQEEHFVEKLSTYDSSLVKVMSGDDKVAMLNALSRNLGLEKFVLDDFDRSGLERFKALIAEGLTEKKKIKDTLLQEYKKKKVDSLLKEIKKDIEKMSYRVGGETIDQSALLEESRSLLLSLDLITPDNQGLIRQAALFLINHPEYHARDGTVKGETIVERIEAQLKLLRGGQSAINDQERLLEFVLDIFANKKVSPDLLVFAVYQWQLENPKAVGKLQAGDFFNIMDLYYGNETIAAKDDLATLFFHTQWTKYARFTRDPSEVVKNIARRAETFTKIYCDYLNSMEGADAIYTRLWPSTVPGLVEFERGKKDGFKIEFFAKFMGYLEHLESDEGRFQMALTNSKNASKYVKQSKLAPRDFAAQLFAHFKIANLSDETAQLVQKAFKHWVVEVTDAPDFFYYLLDQRREDVIFSLVRDLLPGEFDVEAHGEEKMRHFVANMSPKGLEKLLKDKVMRDTMLLRVYYEDLLSSSFMERDDLDKVAQQLTLQFNQRWRGQQNMLVRWFASDYVLDQVIPAILQDLMTSNDTDYDLDNVKAIIDQEEEDLPF